jgi:hypothetical protein
MRLFWPAASASRSKRKANCVLPEPAVPTTRITPEGTSMGGTQVARPDYSRDACCCKRPANADTSGTTRKRFSKKASTRPRSSEWRPGTSSCAMRETTFPIPVAPRQGRLVGQALCGADQAAVISSDPAVRPTRSVSMGQVKKFDNRVKSAGTDNSGIDRMPIHPDAQVEQSSVSRDIAGTMQAETKRRTNWMLAGGSTWQCRA